MKRFLLALSLCLTVLMAAPSAHAQNKAKLRALFEAGAQAYKQGKFLAAVQAFEESPGPDSATHLGLVISSAARRDALTLWHLFASPRNRIWRQKLLGRLTNFYDLPGGCSSAALLSEDSGALSKYRQRITGYW